MDETLNNKINPMQKAKNETSNIAQTSYVAIFDKHSNSALKTAKETTEIQTFSEIAYSEVLLGEADPNSTPFGIKHFWYKA